MIRIEAICRRCNIVLNSYESSFVKGQVNLVLGNAVFSHECVRANGANVLLIQVVVGDAKDLAPETWAKEIEDCLNFPMDGQTPREMLTEQIRRIQTDTRMAIG